MEEEAIMAIMVANMAFTRNAKSSQIALSENARVQENAASADLPDLEHHPAQLRPVVGHLAHLLLRVRGALVGHCQTGELLPNLKTPLLFWPSGMVAVDLDNSLWVPRNAEIAGNSPAAFNY